MEAQITIPEQTGESFKVIDFHYRNQSKIVNVTLEYKGRRDTRQVDLLPVIQEANSTQRAIIKGFFKAVGIAAINQVIQDDGAAPVTSNEVNGDLFNES